MTTNPLGLGSHRKFESAVVIVGTCGLRCVNRASAGTPQYVFTAPVDPISDPWCGWEMLGNSTMQTLGDYIPRIGGSGGYRPRVQATYSTSSLDTPFQVLRRVDDIFRPYGSICQAKFSI